MQTAWFRTGDEKYLGRVPLPGAAREPRRRTRMLATLRVMVHRVLEPLAPAGLPAFHRGDLQARLVDDADTVQDLPLRVVGPTLTAAVAGALSVVLVGTLLPSAGLLLLVVLLASMAAVPAATAWALRRADARSAGLRGRLQAQVGRGVRRPAGPGDHR